MKLFVICFSLLSSSIVMADSGCVALATFVGTYKQVSKSCEAYWFGPTLSVTPYSETRYSGYWINSGPAGFGPTTSATVNDLDKCVSQGNDVAVQICGNANDGSCIPFKGRVSYLFSGSQVNFMADGCSAIYVKQ